MNRIRAIEINIDDEEDDFDEDAFDDENFDFEGDYIEIYEPEEEERVYVIRPNKTQIKKEIAEIAQLAEEIIALGTGQLKSLDLPEHLYTAIVQAAAMPPKGARKRQLKYITAELRKLELAEIQEKIARFKNKSAHAVREHHLAERWRDRLIADEHNEILTEFLAEFPHADSQHIRQLQRNAKKEAASGKPPKSSRLLYKYLKALLEETHQEVPSEHIEADESISDDEFQ